MKIEMGESLIYSWLRHVKQCQVVQTNWKVSSQWELHHEEQLRHWLQDTDNLFYEKHGYRIFKKNSSLSQILSQGECDAIGIRFRNDTPEVYAVEIAFHEGGLLYGSRDTTIMKVLEKMVRAAMCLYGYYDCSNAEILFASPKIGPSVFNGLKPCIEELNDFFQGRNIDFSVQILANNGFRDAVLKPVLDLSNDVADTSELFLRSYQMYKMFGDSVKE